MDEPEERRAELAVDALATPRRRTGGAYTFALSHTAHYTDNWRGAITLYRRQDDGQLPKEPSLDIHTPYGNGGLAFSEATDALYCGSDDGKLRLYRLPDAPLSADGTAPSWESPSSHGAAVTAVAAGESATASSSLVGAVKVWEQTLRSELSLPHVREGSEWCDNAVYALSWTGPHSLATGAADGALRVWDTRTPCERASQTMRVGAGPLRSLAVSSHGLLLAGDESGFLNVVDMRRSESPAGALLATAKAHDGAIKAISLLEEGGEGSAAALGCADGSASVWGVPLPSGKGEPNLREIWRLPAGGEMGGHTDSVCGVGFVELGEPRACARYWALLTSGWDRRILCHDVSNLRVLG